MSESFRLDTGYQFDEIGVTNADEINIPAFSRNIKEVLRTHVGIAQGAFQSLNHKTLLNFGLRLNYFEKFQHFKVEPRIQFNQTLLKNLTVEVLGEQKSQTLAQIIDLQQDFLGIEKRRWAIANEETIPIQKSNQISLGFTYENKNWLVVLDHFYKKVNGITAGSQGFQNQFEFIKAIGSYDIYGSEVLAQKNFKKMDVWMSYSFNHNRYRFDSLNTGEFPNNFELMHVVSSAIIYDCKNLKIALGSRWHSGKPITMPISNTLNLDNPENPEIHYDAPNSSRTAAYLQLNFSASKAWKLNTRTAIQTSISILNLSDKRNVINQFYRINTNDNSVAIANTYSLRRTPNLNVKISF